MLQSTNYSKSYDSANYMRVHNVAELDALLTSVKQVSLLDMLDQNLIDLIYSLRTGQTVMIAQGTNLTTLAYKHYGTTTLWWVILLYNGLFHPMQLQAGMSINIPLKVDIDRYISSLVFENKIGQIVTI